MHHGQRLQFSHLRSMHNRQNEALPPLQIMARHLNHNPHIILPRELHARNHILPGQCLDRIDRRIPNRTCTRVAPRDVARLRVRIRIPDRKIRLEGRVCPVCLNSSACCRIVMWSYIARQRDWSRGDELAAQACVQGSPGRSRWPTGITWNLKCHWI